jgi:hypothetical protein
MSTVTGPIFSAIYWTGLTGLRWIGIFHSAPDATLGFDRRDRRMLGWIT